MLSFKFKDDFWKYQCGMRIWIRNTAFFFANFQNCDLLTGKPRIFVNLRMQINTYKFEFADLRFADWHTLEICRFAIVERAQEFADLRFAD